MNQQPDKLFRDKLEHFQKPVSENAWSRIENNLDQKKSPFLILKIAAVLAVVIGLGWWLMMDNTADTTRQADVRTTKPKQIEKSVIPPVELPSEKATPLAEAKPKPIKAKAPGIKRNNTPSHQSIPKEKNGNYVQRQFENTSSVAETEPQQNIIKDETNVVTESEQNSVRISGNTLVLSADEVNAKYLHHENLQEQATSENKKPSTLQRLLNKVNDLKNNQDPLGELRQKKDEILALNFRGEKQRNQNR